MQNKSISNENLNVSMEPDRCPPTTRGMDDRIFQMVLGIVNLEDTLSFPYLLTGTLRGGSFAEEPTSTWGSHIMAAEI